MNVEVAAFSTSSPLASVALYTATGELVWSRSLLAPNASSGAVAKLLKAGCHETSTDLKRVSRFLADLGPGSFTGVRVGIVMAKVLAQANGAQVAGATSFDLISPEGDAFVPSRKGEVLVRTASGDTQRQPSPPDGAHGYAYGESGDYPTADRFGAIWSQLIDTEPLHFMPAYFAEPSISTPKRAFRTTNG